MQKRATPVKFSEKELEFIKENADRMTIKEIAYILDRPYCSIHTKICELKSYVPRGTKTKKKYTPPPPPEKTFVRPPAVYSNKQYATMYDI